MAFAQRVLLTCTLVAVACAAHGQAPPRGPRPGSLLVERDIAYTADPSLKLDLYRRVTPAGAKAPVVIWLPASQAEAGKSSTPAARLVAAGYAVVSADYGGRGGLDVASVRNAKAAVRWARANAARYGLDPDRVGVWGASEGGRLAALLGTTADVAAIEGVGGDPKISSRVQAVVDFSGPLGAGATSDAMAGALDPRAYVTPDDPPFFIVHGTGDSTVAPEQSRLLQRSLKRAGVQNDLKYVPGAGHSIRETQTAAVSGDVTAFFDRHLRAGQHQRDDLEDINQPTDAWIDAFSDDLAGTTYKLFPTPSRGLGTFASYRLYLPPGYDNPQNARRRYPVIYCMHGLNEDSGKAVNSGYVERLDVAVRTGAMPAAIVVVVQGLNASFYVDKADGSAPVESVFIRDLIPHIDRTYRSIAQRGSRAIEGHSMGGAGALHMAFKYPDLFGSVSAFASALLPVALAESPAAAQRQADTYYSGDVARMEAEAPWTLVEKNLGKIRGRVFVRLICGDQDRLMTPNLWMSKRLDGLGVEHEFIVSKGAPHSVKEVIARLAESPFGYYGKVFAAGVAPVTK